MTCSPHLVGRHGYIIVNFNYFTMWTKAMPTFKNRCKMTTYIFFNHIIARFGSLQAILTDHGKHFQNHLMTKLNAKFGLSHENPLPYYPQANGQVEVVKKFL